jgi:hypothetical protein
MNPIVTRGALLAFRLYIYFNAVALAYSNAVAAERTRWLPR